MKNTKRGCIKREDAIGGGVVDKIISCPWEDVNSVLTDWEKIMKDYKRISIDICLNYFLEHPSYKNVFPKLAEVPDDDLSTNEDFKQHSYAILRGIDSLMSNWSGKYEQENQILSTIGSTHFQRGVTLDMMFDLKESLLFICCNFLKSTRKQKASWALVFNHIFYDYLCSAFPQLKKGDEKEDEEE
ncbi:hypothetical protein RUM44_006994 [Polyplax serrata]|uniref:Globin domain-containing protein n=1 Tax=Polyplax serrata TaxID=468196 RepID=A0ABR1AZY3_POLSC